GRGGCQLGRDGDRSRAWRAQDHRRGDRHHPATGLGGVGDVGGRVTADMGTLGGFPNPPASGSGEANCAPPLRGGSAPPPYATKASSGRLGETRVRRHAAWLTVTAAYLVVFPYFEGLGNPNENVRVWMTRAVVVHGALALDAVEGEWGRVSDRASFGG